MDVAKNCMDGYFSTARANYAVGDLGTSVVPNVKIPSVTVDVKTENVAGVKLAVFDMNHDPRYDLTAYFFTCFEFKFFKRKSSQHCFYFESLLTFL